MTDTTPAEGTERPWEQFERLCAETAVDDPEAKARPTPPVPAAEDDAVERAARIAARTYHGSDAYWGPLGPLWTAVARAALAAAGWDALVAEVERLRASVERKMARLRDADRVIEAAEAERDRLREAWAIRRDDVIRLLNDNTVSHVERINGADDLLRLPLLLAETGQPSSPAPVVPDSAGLRERIDRAVDENLRPYMVNPAHRSDAVEPITDAVLAVVGQGECDHEKAARQIARTSMITGASAMTLLDGIARMVQGVSAEQAEVEALDRYPSEYAPGPYERRAFVAGALWAVAHPSGQEPTTRGAGA